jgi:O-antigen/teichoic acid export membrane protein
MTQVTVAASDTTMQGQARQRMALFTSVVSLLARASSFLATLITIPLAMQHLGTVRFGLWMTLSSLASLFTFADFGLGNALMTVVASAKGRGDSAQLQRHIRTGLALLAAVSCSLLVVFSWLHGWLADIIFTAVKDPAVRREAVAALAVLAVCVAANVVASAVPRIQLGLQRGHTASFWQLCGTALALPATIVSLRLELGLPSLVAAALGAPVLAQGLNGLFALRSRRSSSNPLHTACFDQREVKKLSRLAGLFFLLQAGSAVSSSADSILVMRMLGPEAVASYALAAKLYGFIGLFLSIFLTPLWPAYAEALAAGDHAWVRRMLIRSLITATAAASSAVLVLGCFGPTILRLWVHDAPLPPRSLLWGLGTMAIMEAGGGAVAMLLNASAVMRLQIIQASAFIAICIVLRVTLIRMVGMAGAAWGNAIAYFLIMVVPYAFVVPRLVHAESRKQ